MQRRRPFTGSGSFQTHGHFCGDEPVLPWAWPANRQRRHPGTLCRVRRNTGGSAATAQAEVLGGHGAVILPTRNRTAFDLADLSIRLTPETIFNGLGRHMLKGDVEHLFPWAAFETARHLFRVISGLESMVAGGTDIFSQVKRAYHIALKLGVTGKYLYRPFQKSFQVGKDVRPTRAFHRAQTLAELVGG